MIDTSVELAKLFAALAKAQGTFDPIGKDKSAKITMKAGGAYSYRYADLAAILSAVRLSLSANGLAILQLIEVAQDGVVVTTILAHTSGQRVVTALRLPIDDPHDPRSVASAITYARRYSLISLIGVAPSDEDDDGEAAQPTRPRTAMIDPFPETERHDLETAEDGRTDPPQGYRYIDRYWEEHGWHHITFLHADAQGGAMTYTTKFEQLGALASHAFQEGVPVQVEGTPKGKDGCWLNKLTVWHAETEPEAVPNDADIPF